MATLITIGHGDRAGYEHFDRPESRAASRPKADASDVAVDEAGRGSLASARYRNARSASVAARRLLKAPRCADRDHRCPSSRDGFDDLGIDALEIDRGDSEVAPSGGLLPRQCVAEGAHVARGTDLRNDGKVHALSDEVQSACGLKHRSVGERDAEH